MSNFYKKIIRSKKLRFKILSVLKFIPDDKMIKLQYWLKHGRRLNLEKPIRYTEKIQWYKLNYHDPIMAQCADKYGVREYITSKGLENILIPLYGVYDDIKSVEWTKLPQKFVIKTTNGSGTNFFCRNKENIDKEAIVKQFETYFEQSNASAGREWVYKSIAPKIVVEKLMEDFAQEDGSINDYKFLCFNGEPTFIVYDTDRFTNHKRNIYDLQWNDLHVASDCPCSNRNVQKPAALEEMLRVSRILSKDFPAVRVDLYLIEGRIYFGELTFFPWSGYVQFTPDTFDFILGDKFVLPNKRCDGDKT